METNRKGLVNRKWIVAVLVYIGLIAICCIALYAVPSVKGILERTYIAEHGSIDVKDEVSAFIVRDETVYVAAEDCSINRLTEPGKLVKAKTRVVELTPDDKSADDEAAEETSETEKESKDGKKETSETKKESKDGKKETSKDEEETPEDEEVNAGRYTKLVEELGDAVVVTDNGRTRSAGYISYHLDGAEASLSTDSLDQLTEKDFKSYTGRRALRMPQKSCGKGFPVFKVVRNSKWYLVFYMKNEDAEKYTVGDTVSIEINEKPVTVTVSEVVSGRKRSRIVLTCKSFFDGFLEMRELDTTITVVSAEGLVLEDQSIVEAPDGKRGVFVKNKLGDHVFTPVMVKADDGVKCVVFSDIYVDAEGNYVETIGTYDEIIAEPSEEDIASLKEEAAPAEGENSEKSGGNEGTEANQ